MDKCPYCKARRRFATCTHQSSVSTKVGETANIPLTLSEVDLLREVLQLARDSKQGSHDEDPQRVTQLNTMRARLLDVRGILAQEE